MKEDSVRAAVQQGEVKYFTRAVARAQADFDRLTITAPCAGQVLKCLEPRETNRFLPPGAELARLGSGLWLVRVLVTEQALASIQPRLGQPIRVCILSREATWTTATVERIAVAGSSQIDVPQLTHLAGGRIAVDAHTMNAHAPYFEIRLQIDHAKVAPLRCGMGVLAQFPSVPETIGIRLCRAAQRFLNRLRQV
jgi:hypothetical protein